MEEKFLNAAKSWITEAKRKIESNELKVAAISLLFAVKSLNKASDGVLISDIDVDLINHLIRKVLE